MDNFKCPDCNKTIVGRVAFESHIDEHTRIFYTCDKCGKDFRSWDDLDSHKDMDECNRSMRFGALNDRLNPRRKPKPRMVKLVEFDIKKCTRCEHEQVFTGLQPLWSPFTHWWFSPDQKKVVFTLIACRSVTINKPKKYQSILSFLPRDVLFIVIQNVFEANVYEELDKPSRQKLGMDISNAMLKKRKEFIINAAKPEIEEMKKLRLPSSEEQQQVIDIITKHSNNFKFDALKFDKNTVLQINRPILPLKQYCDSCVKEIVKYPKCPMCILEGNLKQKVHPELDMYELHGKCSYCNVKPLWVCKLHTRLDVIRCESCIGKPRCACMAFPNFDVEWNTCQYCEESLPWCGKCDKVTHECLVLENLITF